MLTRVYCASPKSETNSSNQVSNFGWRQHGILWNRSASPIRCSLPARRQHGASRDAPSSGSANKRLASNTVFLDSHCVTNHTLAVRESDTTQSRAKSLVLRQLHSVTLHERKQQGTSPHLNRSSYASTWFVKETQHQLIDHDSSRRRCRNGRHVAKKKGVGQRVRSTA